MGYYRLTDDGTQTISTEVKARGSALMFVIKQQVTDTEPRLGLAPSCPSGDLTASVLSTVTSHTY